MRPSAKFLLAAAVLLVLAAPLAALAAAPAELPLPAAVDPRQLLNTIATLNSSVEHAAAVIHKMRLVLSKEKKELKEAEADKVDYLIATIVLAVIIVGYLVARAACWCAAPPANPNYYVFNGPVRV